MGRKNHTRVAHVEEAKDAEARTEAEAPENAEVVPRGRRSLLRKLARLRSSALGQYLTNSSHCNYNLASSSSCSSSLGAGGHVSCSSYYYGNKKAESESSEHVHLQMASVIVYGWLF